MKSLHASLAGSLVLLLMQGCGAIPGQSILPFLNPPSQVPTVVPPTFTPPPTNTPRPTVTSIPPPTRRATAVLPTITPLPSVTPIPELTSTSSVPIIIPTPKPQGPPKPMQCHLESTFPEQGSLVRPRDDFIGIWRVINTGTASWSPKDIAFFFVSGTAFQSAKYQEDFIPFIVNPGDQINLHVPMRTPKEPGSYSATWGLRSKSSKTYFCFVSLFLIVDN